MLKKDHVFFILALTAFATNCLSQTTIDSISSDEIKKTITFLASDKLKGRINYTREQLIATEFIAKELDSYGLEPFPGFNNFYQPFGKFAVEGSNGLILRWNDKKIPDSNFLFLPSGIHPENKNLSDFFIIKMNPPIADSVLLYNCQDSAKNFLLWVPLTPGMIFEEAIQNLVIPLGLPPSDILIVGSSEDPMTVTLTYSKQYAINKLYNIVGVLPGRSKPGEAIVFSAHYDHIDPSMASQRNGTFSGNTGVMNGANDNASGTTAVLALARYFAMRHDNDRTIIFCLFAGEELGLLGSKAFVKNIAPDNIKAVINIEMIGMTNATGKNAFMVTGSQYSDLVPILKKNLPDLDIKVIPQTSDPGKLYERSDNYPFAQEGIVAHTIMCSDDNDLCYHQGCDEVERIDILNMTRIIQAIARGSLSLIAGTDTPIKIMEQKTFSK